MKFLAKKEKRINQNISYIINIYINIYAISIYYKYI